MQNAQLGNKITGVGNIFWLKLYKVICWYINKSMDDFEEYGELGLACRASKDSHLRWSSIEVTLLVLRYLLVTYLAARHCTISTLLTYSLVWGLQTVEQY